MRSISTIESVRQNVKQWQFENNSIAFVPTMGNLHQGHLQLVKIARAKADKVVVSIFVNPTQFSANEDFASYPRTLEADQRKLRSEGCDLLFIPEAGEMYPEGSHTRVMVDELSYDLCGASRPGHFSGVATVVCKLFNIVQPDFAVFGQKDYQQLLIIRQMVIDLNLDLSIVDVETQREKDGLALSSRNIYLSEQQRQLAPLLYQSLNQAKQEIMMGECDFSALEDKYRTQLEQCGFKVDYFAVYQQYRFKKAEKRDKSLVILVAAKLDSTRLIDNLCFCR